MNDDAITEREDAAIARALDQPGTEATGVDGGTEADSTERELREVLSHLSPELAPPAGLEARVMAAARSVRAPSGAPTGAEPDTAPITAGSEGEAGSVVALADRRRQRARRWMLPSVAAAAAVAALALVVLRPDGGAEPGSVVARVVSAPEPAELSALLDDPAARSADLRDGAGHAVGKAVVGADGVGYLYDLDIPAAKPGERPWLWLVHSGTPVSAGTFHDGARSVGFTVDGEVDGVLVTFEHVTGVPERPGRTAAEGDLRTRR